MGSRRRRRRHHLKSLIGHELVASRFLWLKHRLSCLASSKAKQVWRGRKCFSIFLSNHYTNTPTGSELRDWVWELIAWYIDRKKRQIKWMKEFFSFNTHNIDMDVWDDYDNYFFSQEKNFAMRMRKNDEKHWWYVKMFLITYKHHLEVSVHRCICYMMFFFLFECNYFYFKIELLAWRQIEW